MTVELRVPVELNWAAHIDVESSCGQVISLITVKSERRHRHANPLAHSSTGTSITSWRAAGVPE